MVTDVLNALVLIANFVIVPGLAYGSQLALGALGVTLVYSVLRFSNFAHGEMMSFGAMGTVLMTWWLQSQNISLGGLPTALLALPFGILGAIALCLFVDRTVFSYYPPDTVGRGDLSDCLCRGDVCDRRAYPLHHRTKRQGVCRW